MALRLGAGLYHFWTLRGYLREGRDWLERALAHAGDEFPALRARALVFLGHIASDWDDHATARSHYEASLALWRELGDRRGIASCLASLGIVAYGEGNFGLARRLHEESLGILRDLGDEEGMALAQYYIANVDLAEGNFERAQALFEEALAGWQALGHAGYGPYAQLGLGRVARFRGHRAEAIQLFDQVLTALRGVGDKGGIGVTLRELGRSAHERGEDQLAVVYYEEALTFLQEVGGLREIAECLEGLASVATSRGQAERAAELLGASATWRATAKAPVVPSDRATYDDIVARAREGLGDAAFSEAWAVGAKLTLAESIARAQPVLMAAQAVVADQSERSGEHSGLTPREIDVLRLVVEGHSSREIADLLFVSHRTVSTHITSIFNKLGVGSRSAAAAYAVRHELV